MQTVADAARIAYSLPEVTDGERYGNPTEAVLAANADGASFTIPHVDGYAAVLIQLDLVGEVALREAIVDAWLASAPRRLADAYLERESRP